MKSSLIRTTFAWLILIVLSSASIALAEYWTPDTTFAPVIEGYTGLAGGVGTTSYPGGRLLISTSYGILNGKILSSAATSLSLMKSDGTLDDSFISLQGPSAGAIAVYPDGRILIGTHPNNNSSHLIQRLLTNGAVDPSFPSILANSYVNRATILADGRILISGDFTAIGGTTINRIALLAGDGTLDGSFHSPFSADSSVYLYSVTPTSDAVHIIVAGGNLNLGTGLGYVARLNMDGSVDSGFNAEGAAFSSIISRVYPDVSGTGMWAVKSASSIVHLTSSGMIDSSFSPALIGGNWDFGTQQADGKIFYRTLDYVSGTYSRILRRMNANGSDDGSFHSISTPYACSYEIGMPTLSDDGTLFIGPMTAERHNARLEVTHVMADGTIDPGFNPRFSRFGSVSACAQQSDGKHLIAGIFDYINNTAITPSYGFVRLNSNGTLDSSFNPDLPVNSSISHIAVQPSGKILLFGWFPHESSGSTIMRINTDGSTDASFPSFASTLYAVAVDTSGYTYGYSDNTNSPLSRYTPNGVLDPTFQAPTLAGILFTTALSDGAVLVGTVNYSNTYKIIRLLHDGTVDPSFNVVSGYNLAALVALPNGGALYGDGSNAPQPNARYHSINRLLPDGTSDYGYASPLTFGSGPRQDTRLAMAGSVFDLLRAAAPTTSTFVDADFTHGEEQMELICRTEGQIIIRSTSQFDNPYQAYQRTILTSPSMDAAPSIIAPQTTPATTPPLGGSFFASVTAIGLSPFTYVWKKNGITVPDQMSATLYIPTLKASDAGNYTVTVSNAYGSVVSSASPLIIDTAHLAATIVSHPSNQRSILGGTVTFSIVASGNPTPTYQWLFNGTSISGANSATFVLNNVQPANVGNYTATVSNISGSFIYFRGSHVATLTIISPAATGDFNGDSHSDVLWHDATSGTVSSWPSGGGFMTFGTEDNDWTVIGKGDFDGDGKVDLLWRNLSSGLVVSWTSASGYQVYGTQSGSWSVINTGDFDGDGQTDVLWHNLSNGVVASWTSNGGYHVYGMEDGQWTVVGTGDFDGDGKMDVLWRNINTGIVASWTSTSGYRVYGTEGSGWSVINIGDFDGDGKADVLWHNTNTGIVASWTSTSGYHIYGVEDNGWLVISTGDFDGDGITDVLWHNTSSHAVASWTSQAGYSVFGSETGEWSVIP